MLLLVGSALAVAALLFSWLLYPADRGETPDSRNDDSSTVRTATMSEAAPSSCVAMAPEGSPGQEPACSESSTVPTIETTVGAADPTFTICGVNVGGRETMLHSAETMLEAYRIFEECHLDGHDADFVVVAGGRRLGAHKALLAERIQYFYSLFMHGCRENSTGVIAFSTRLCPFEPEHIVSLIGYSYHGECTMTEDNVASLLEAAVYLQMDTIIEACAHFMLKRVRCETALSLLALFRSAGFHQLDDRLWRYIYANFVPISRTPSFTEISVVDLISILQWNSLRIDSEEQVLEAIGRWIEADSTRSKDAARLLEYCRLASLSDSFIELIRSHDSVKDNPVCLRLLSQHKDMVREDRYYNDSIRMICVLEAYQGILRILNPLTGAHTDVATSWMSPYYLRAAVIGPKIFFVCDDYNSGRALDIRTNEWSDFPAMPSVRAAAAVGVIDEVIYVAGGEDTEENPTASLIALNTRQPQPEWVELAPMTIARWRAATCVHKGLLYVFGGNCARGLAPANILKHCETYDPSTNEWTAIAPMWSACRGFNAVVFKDKIFIGGDWRFEEYCVTTNTWTRRANFADDFMSADLFTLGGRIVSVANNQIWDEASDEWTDLEPLQYDGYRMEDCIFAVNVPASVPLSLAAVEDPYFGHNCWYDEMNVAVGVDKGKAL